MAWNDANAVEALRGRELYVDRAHAVELPEDADFIVDLIGCRVVDDEGTEYGRIVDVMQPGGGDVYVIDGPRGEVLVPALKSVVLDVDTRAGLMRMSAARMREVAVFEDRVLTIFPEMIEPMIHQSILGRAQEAGGLSISRRWTYARTPTSSTRIPTITRLAAARAW